MTAAQSTRRGFLGRALVLAPTAALGGLALGDMAEAGAVAESPLRDLLRRHIAVSARIRERNGAWGAPPHLRALQEADKATLDGLAREIEAAPITSLEDLAVVLFVAGHIPGEKWQLRERCWAFVEKEANP